jgi:hypothetical protein
MDEQIMMKTLQVLRRMDDEHLTSVCPALEARGTVSVSTAHSTESIMEVEHADFSDV